MYNKICNWSKPTLELTSSNRENPRSDSSVLHSPLYGSGLDTDAAGTPLKQWFSKRSILF